MKINNLGLRISLIASLIVAAIITLVVFVVTARTDTLVSELTGTQAKTANQAFAKTLQNYQEEAYSRANMIASSQNVIDAITEGDEAALRQALVPFNFSLDLITVVDRDGNVLVRTHDDKADDSLGGQAAISSALTTGQGSATIEQDADVMLSTAGTAAVRDAGGNIIAAVKCGHDLSLFKYVDDIKDTNNCEVTIFDWDTRLSTSLTDDNGNRVIGTKAGDAVIAQVLRQGQDYATQLPLFGNEYAVYYSPLVVEGKPIGMLFAGVKIDEILADKSDMITTVLAITISVGVAGVILMFIMCMFTIGRPLKKMGALAEKIKGGELGLNSSSPPPSIDIRSSDEIGVMARTLEQAYLQLRGYVGEIKDKLKDIANGDLTAESTYKFDGDFKLIGASINFIITNLNKTMADIYSSAAQVSLESKQISDGAHTLARGSTEQAASVERFSSTISEIAKKTKDNADLAGRAAALANTIKGTAEKGSQQMGEMMIAVKDITQASQSITKVIKVINDIAFQTNILALNAAVEAARAGQHGKGFAVVAEEVRNLAAKSAEAASETGALIADSAEKAELGARIAGSTSASLDEIVAGIIKSSQIVGEIAKSSEEQSAGIASITRGINEVSDVVNQNSATAGESAAASEKMSGQSHLLEELIGEFRLKAEYLHPKEVSGK